MSASKSAADKLKAGSNNPFKGMTLAQMKKKYSAMTPAQRKANVETFRAAAKVAPKPKKAPVPKGGSKPRQTTPAEAKSRFFRSSSGTRGQSRPSNSPGPAVVKPGSRTGASVDPRERQLRKNRQEAAAAARRNRPASGQGGRSFAKRSGVAGRTSAPSTSRGRLSAAERRRARRSSR